MHLLIDGYNLLYAIGRLSPRSPRGALQEARRWLLSQLRGRHAPGTALTVVFDGSPGQRPRDDQLGISVRFSHGESADDVIEDILAASPPASLTVISDDHRLQQAARRRGCDWVGCLDYYDADSKTPRSTPPPEPPAKPESSSPEEVERYLRAFGEADGL